MSRMVLWAIEVERDDSRFGHSEGTRGADAAPLAERLELTHNLSVAATPEVLVQAAVD